MILAANASGVETLLQRLAWARAETDALFALVDRASLYERPIAERHRLIFYLGHLEAFDWNLLQPKFPGTAVFDATLDHLFAFGIDPIGGALPSDQPSDWPNRAQVEGYNRRVRSTLNNALERLESWQGNGEETPRTLLNVAIEHRLMHAETLTYMLHQMPLKNLKGVKQAEPAACISFAPELLRIPSGPATLGLPQTQPDIQGWDNEFDEHRVEVPGFAIDKYKVTNGDYMEFVQAGGYRRREFWSEAGWRWKKEHGIEHPVFWRNEAGEWRLRALFEEIPLPAAWPVYTSHAEASAYAAWKGSRLPSEAEWHRAAYGTPDGSERQFPWGAQEPGTQHGYWSMRRWDPSAVNAYPAGASGFGVEGMLCNGWEWTSTPFAPFPGFRSFPWYPGYSANFFDGHHYVLKGGSPRTEGCMLRRSFRNWFQPHYQYVYAGFRCAAD